MIVSSREALSRINKRLKRPISQPQFCTIYELMAQQGIALSPEKGQRGAVIESELWKWSVYLTTRENLILAGVWSAKRKYALQDYDDIVSGGLYEDYQ